MKSRTIPKRQDIDEKDKWDLTPLFESHENWQGLFDKINGSIDGYSEYQGKLGESAWILVEAIEFHLELFRNIEKLYTYAHLKSDQDKSDSFYLGMYDRARNLHTRASEKASFLTPEIQGISSEKMEEYKKDERLSPYDFYLEQILRLKPHTLDQKTEQILAMSGEMAQAASQIFGQLDNVDLTFGTITDHEGHEVELSHGNFISLLMSPDREVRKSAFRQYYDVYDRHKHTIAAALSHSIKKDLFYCRVRSYESCRRASLFSDNIPDSVYDNLIETVRNNLRPLFKYLKFRKSSLELDRLHFYDTYVPIVSDIDFRMSYEDAVETVTTALSPLGADYTQTLKQGLLEGWVDRYENKGKRSGAYVSGCYDSSPYILLNYQENNINSLFTMAHEAGHAMHSFYSNRKQPYVYHDYTIFVAEVASTFNEVLLSDYLMKIHQDDSRMTAYILNREIDNIRGTLFRQTMFAEFEKITHELVEQNTPLTMEVITREYRNLLDIYFGDVMVIDPELHLECLRIPHFYSPFYVYKYATGISAAIALARKVLDGAKGARDAYLQFLTLGGSKFPLDELKTAGVDLGSKTPIEKASAHFAELVDRLIRT